ncbi:MAG TPA: LamG domain-containing protein, partial [Roseivirga sp.]
IITATTGITDLTFEESDTIFWTFTDSSGNPVIVEQEVIITDTTAPEPDVKTLPEKRIEGCEISSIEELDLPTATDACEGPVTGTLSSNFQFPYSTPGTDIITWEYTDSHGNKTFQEQKVTFIPVTINGGTISGSYNSSDFQNMIEITSCEESATINLRLTGQLGEIVRWERLILNEGIWEHINNTSSTLHAEFQSGELESTIYRARIKKGTCIEYSDVFEIKAIPPGPRPTVTNLGSEEICLGDEVSLKATIEGIATPGDAIPGSEGDFHNGQFKNDWLVDGEDGGFTCGGNNEKTRNWSCTSKAHDFGDITYDSGSKFAIAQGDYTDNNFKGENPTTLETPILDLSNALSASLDFDQAYHFANNDEAIIEISIDGGENYAILVDMHEGNNVKAWYTEKLQAGEPVGDSDAENYNFSIDNTSISLQDYLGQSRVRIRWSFSGTSDKSIWALDNIIVKKNASVTAEVEWTEGIGDPDEDPITVGDNEATISFQPDTPGVHLYGGTALINGCRTYNEEGTNLVEIRVSYAYAGENIEFSSEECGQNIVQLNAYDNTKTARENIEKETFEEPVKGCKKCDAPGTQMKGEWSIVDGPGVCGDFTASFSDPTLPDATFKGPAGTYTLAWTLENGCSDDVLVTIKDCTQINFDGINDHIDFGDNYDLGAAFSLEAWIKPGGSESNSEAPQGTQTIFSKRDANYSENAKGYDLKITNGIVSFNWDQTGKIASTHQIKSNRWYHIAVTHTGSGQYQLYIDGIPLPNNPVGGGSPSENSYRAILGAMDSNGTNGADKFFEG